jgi:pilus assembly protein Flp/PilA
LDAGSGHSPGPFAWLCSPLGKRRCDRKMVTRNAKGRGFPGTFFSDFSPTTKPVQGTTLALTRQSRSLFMSKIFAFVRDESGATAIEYGLIAALISVVIITAVKLIGTNLVVTFNAIAAAVK